MHRVVLLAFLFVLLAVGCVSEQGTKTPPSPGPPAVTLGDPGQFHEAAALCRKENRVLIIPKVREFPSHLWQPLRDYLDQGGAAVFVGCDPFEARVRFVDGRSQTEEELFRELMANARKVERISDVGGWRHENDSGKSIGSLQPEPAEISWRAFRVEVGSFRDWDAVMVDATPGTISENSVAFFARGDANTSRLAVICVEEDGSHWFHTLGVNETWQPFVLHQAKFHYFYGGSNRGKPGDHFSFAMLKKISIGLSMHLGAQEPGSHSFAVSEFRFVNDPRPANEAAAWPDLMLLSPPYRRYDLAAANVNERGRHSLTLAATKVRMQSPLARARGTGGERAAPFRWIPVFEARDRNGAVLGWPASIYVEPGDNGTVKKWAWVATEPVVEPMVAECVRRLQAGRFLHHAGVGRSTFQAGDKIEATARWTPGDPPVRVIAELLTHDWRVLQRTTSPTIPDSRQASGGQAVFDLGVAPTVGKAARDFLVRITLADARDSKGIYDRAEQLIKVLSRTTPARCRAPSENEWIKTDGAHFRFRERPLFLLGINYWPLSHNGKATGEYNAHWLEPGAFDPEIILRDLDRLREVGINAVSIQYHDEAQAPQLRWFADECRKRGIWVHCFVGYLQPQDQDLPKAQRLIELADLKNCPQIFAIDVSWEPKLGSYADRCRFDRDWEAWVREQYGSVEHAEEVIGVPFLTKDGVITGPSDQELRTDGSHRVFVAVYRRFIDDMMSRRYGEVARLVRRLGCKQLLSARSGYGGTGNPWADPFLPIDMASGVVHFDFTSAEGYALTGDLDQFHEGGFLTAYARGVGGGKPATWVEFGSSVGVDPNRVDLENQARIYRNMAELAVRSGAAATFAWWYPGGYRVDEKSDFGAVNPDSTWRPAGIEYRKLGERVRREPFVAQPWRGREVDRFADARGLSALWDKWRVMYREEMRAGRIEEVRPVGFGKLTTELPVVSLGDRPFQEPAPLKFVNAEWGRIEVDGVEIVRAPGATVRAKANEKLRLELINTGLATWTASDKVSRTIWVEARDRERTSERWRVPGLSFSERAWVLWTAAEGNWQLRPLLQDIGPFGEPLKVEVIAH